MGRLRLACALVAALSAASVGGAEASAQETPPPAPVDAPTSDAPTAPAGFWWHAIEGDGKHARPDDLLTPRRLSDVPLLRGKSATPTLRIDGLRTYEVAADGTETLVALSLGLQTPNSSAGGAPAPALTKAELAGLRGISIHGWRPEYADILAAIDGSQCAVRAEVRVPSPAVLQNLPRGVRVLCVSVWGAPPPDMAALSKYPELRWLTVEGRADDVRDWSFLRELRVLRYLEADIRDAAAATVPDMPSVTSLLTGGEGLTDISLVRRFPALRDLTLMQCSVTDLRPLAALQDLSTCFVYTTPVEKLPVGTLRKLETFSFLYHRVPSDEVRAFVAANPQCAVEHSPSQSFAPIVASADRVRLRTGGLCHRAVDEERVLFETSDPDELRALLALIEFDDSKGGGMCGCCGEPTLELFREGKPLASYGVHHGAALRGPGLLGDARLAPESSDAFCAWLRDHGAEATGIGESRRATESQRKARVAAQDGVIGAERGHALRMAIDSPAAIAMLGEWWPDAAVRVDMALRFVAVSEPGEQDPEPASAAARRVASYLGYQEDRAVVLAALERLFSSPETAILGANAVSALDGGWFPRLADEVKAALRLKAATVYFATQKHELRRKGLRLLYGLDENADVRALLLSQLPPPAADGAPASRASDFQMQAALALFPRADEALRRRITALAETAVNAKHWQREIADALERAR